MADVKISELSAKTTLDGTEELPVNDGGTTKKTSVAAVRGVGPFTVGTVAPTTASLDTPLQVNHLWLDTTYGSALRRCTAVDGGGEGTWELVGAAEATIPMAGSYAPGGVISMLNPEGVDLIVQVIGARVVTMPVFDQDIIDNTGFAALVSVVDEPTKTHSELSTIGQTAYNLGLGAGADVTREYGTVEGQLRLTGSGGYPCLWPADHYLVASFKAEGDDEGAGPPPTDSGAVGLTAFNDTPYAGGASALTYLDTDNDQLYLYLGYTPDDEGTPFDNTDDTYTLNWAPFPSALELAELEAYLYVRYWLA